MVDDNSRKPATASKHTLFISIEGEANTLAAEGEAIDTIAAVLEALGAKHGRADLRDFTIAVEDTDGEIVATATVHEVLRGERHGRLHLHRCRRVQVSVEYNAKTVRHEFAPGTTVNRVQNWAVSPEGFNIATESHDLELQVVGSTVALAPNVHIGTLVRKPKCELALQLVPTDRHQG